jgi:alpha-D-xyloside xylohydrolase
MFTLETHDTHVVFTSGKRRLRITFPSPAIARVTWTEDRPFLTRPSLIVVPQPPPAAFTLHGDAATVTISTGQLTLVVNRVTGAIRYLDPAGGTLLAEPERGGTWLTPKKVFRNVFTQGARAATGQSIDGARASAEAIERVFDRDAFEAKLEFCFAEDEALFGLGSHEEGYGNLRGRSRELYQQNMKAVVPCLVSTRGYALLLDCHSLMTFHDDALGSYWWADVVDELDFYFVRGATFDDVTRGLHQLTGPAPLPPKWLFGYAQSKERYVNAEELLAVVREYRRRRIPLDLIVLDWKSWPNGAGWGQKSFDPVRFPDPDALASELHAMGAKLMVSIWPIMTGGCPDQQELLERGLMLGNQSTYDAFRPEARATYWEQARRGLFAHGVDAWWCDCTEPFEADWQGAVKPEPHARLALNTEASKRYLDPGYINSYSLLHSQGIHEGQRAAAPDRRVVNLTRSSYAGQHRYGTITWNGDVCATWETLRRCIPEGVNFCVTGEPYWTVDIGGFFINHDRSLWFWRGDYAEGCRGLTDMHALEPDPRDTGCRDLGFHELYVRWLQYAAFLPMMRSHGTDAAREAWRFGEAGTPFHDAIVDTIRLRYRFVPYLYSLAAAVTFHGRMMIRSLALEFPGDPALHSVDDQFLLGPSLMVCPVTRPMYYERESRPLAGVAQTRSVRLPAGARWFDFWNEQLFDGGRTIEADAPLGKIPLFVRAGSILPMTEVAQYVDETPAAPYEIRVYRGADAAFTLYEDAGDGHAYEQGARAFVRLTWCETHGELTLAARDGTFPGLVAARDYAIVFISSGCRTSATVRYDGSERRVRAAG